MPLTVLNEDFIVGAIIITQFVFLFYFIGLTLSYIILNTISFFHLTRYLGEHSLSSHQLIHPGYELPITFLIPAHNEEKTIEATIHSTFSVEYPAFEIIVINDGSADRTMERLIETFDLEPFPEAYWVRIKTKNIKNVYQSKIYPHLRVVDKEGGGKADALNAGLNIARNPLFCTIDADSVLQKDSLARIVQPFVEDITTVAAGATIRVSNGCEVQGGHIVNVDLPKNMLSLIQVVEYLRAFLFGRIGWSPSNGLLIISGAFGVFRTNAVVNIGGYNVKSITEDMELVVRLHRILSTRGEPYRIVSVPDPVCWTEVPEDLKTLKNQRIRWQHGLFDTLFKNRKLLFNPKAKVVGNIAFPFYLFFEGVGPLIEVFGYIVIPLAALFNILSLEAMVLFFGVAIGCGTLLSVTALFLEEISFRVYKKGRHLFSLFIAIVMENFGYRQLTSIWRLIGLFTWIAVGDEKTWGKMTRSAAWIVKQQVKKISS
jgi:cellulose synthase/poly-beta-1,6-N-acetylglucosamine synthase-like glycosyltransferase